MIGFLVGLAVLDLLVLTAGPVGVTWDEPIYSEAAERVARWLGIVARGDLAQAFDPYAFGISWGLVNEHPPLVRVLNGLGWALTRNVLPVPTSHRVGTMALAALAIGMLVAVTGRQRGLGASLFAGAAVLAMPRLFFHAHLGALDFPHAATWLLATLGFYRAMQSPRWWSPLLIGLGLGLALLTKINAVLLVPFWGIWLLAYRRTWRALLAYLLSLPVALAVLIAGWPWIWKDPVEGLVNWMRFFSTHFEIRQWFAGRLYVQTPWYLPLAMLLITTPVALLLLAIAGLIWGLRSDPDYGPGRINGPANYAGLRNLQSPWTGLHWLGMLAVLGYYALRITAIHDQERLLLPVFLHLAILAGDGFAVVVRVAIGDLRLAIGNRQSASRPTPYVIRLALAALLLLPGILGIVRLHPFELSYYNALIGGTAGANRLGMETTYLASTYGYFLPWLNGLPAGSKLWVMPNSWDVIYYYQRNGLLRNDIAVLRPSGWGSFYDDAGVLRAAGGLEAADYALIDRRQTTFNNAIPEYAIQLQWAATKPELARLERDGVLLAALYRR